MLDFAREYEQIGPELLSAVESVFRSQRFILGPEVASFEQSAARHCGVAEAVGCGSGTDALWLAMAAAGIQPGDRVLTTAFSFFATASSILRLGATPVLEDIDPRTCNLDPNRVAVALQKHPATRAILPVHLYGQCADWTALTHAAAGLNCLLIEDAAQAFGAKWEGIPAGALGTAAAFSFYPTKNLSAAGEAGMVTTSSAAIARRVRRLRAHGMEVRYFHEEIGWNSRLDTLQAAVLLVKLRHVDEWNQRRRTLAARYNELFAAAGVADPGPYPDRGVVLPWADPRAHHVYHQYVIRTARRDELRAWLTEQGIGSEIYYPLALHQQKALAFLGYREGDFPESERAAREVLALPIFPQLRDDEQERVVGAICDFLSRG
ncbi:MAG TPA: DegT/DnrJ/EryC1/StrS family aminotransferase [Acidobacteriaceae bacterium]|nr:DegT/DnrJ/EryC1/StrS family aminotransferase [Acidobacteriaceae bacterium]